MTTNDSAAVLDAPPPASLDAAALWRPERVCEFTTLDRTTLGRLVRAGSFPAPVRVTPGRIAWRAADVVAWAASRPTAPVGEPETLAAANAGRRRGRAPARRGRTPIR